MTDRAVLATIIALSMTAGATVTATAQSMQDGRRSVVLKSPSASATFDVGGGALVDFRLNGMTLNPFTWNTPPKGDTEPRPMGHFICFDRWGQPSANEAKNGMPFHGEATSVVWAVPSQPREVNGSIQTEMNCKLPIGGMSLRRTARLSMKSPVLEVTEHITNDNLLGRVYNIVQHPSIAPPFLDDTVIVDSNALKGYMQESPWPKPEEPVIYWPFVAYKGALVDLRKLSSDSSPSVTSFVFDDKAEYGWVTASNPGLGLLVGYIWKTAEYPWLNIWRNTLNGSPAARGLEFGTTGLHKPFADILEKHTIFDHRLCEYIDAGQQITKSYIAFLAEIPPDYHGVARIEHSPGIIVIHERDREKAMALTLTY